MFVSMWMTRDVLTVPPTATLTEIATLMMRQRIRRLPVVSSGTERGSLLGIVTHSDVLHAFPPDINPFAINAAESIAAIAAIADRVRLTAADLMAREPRTTTPEAPLESAARLMRDHKIGALPVLSKYALVGLITESDIFRAMVEVFETKDRAVRVTFSLKPGEDVLPLVAEIARQRNLRVTSFMSLPRHDPPCCVVQLAGAKLDEALEDVWKSQHRVINVVQLGLEEEGEKT
jgi:acetoin utilization protein AcuB